jgi:hypothetical protein
MLRLCLVTVAVLAASPASYVTNNCDAIRAEIEAKVRASGVTNFALSVAEANAKVPGKVVGSCALGTKKIVYNRSSSAAASEPKAKAAEESIITECKDGSVIVGGDCKK